jgi:hypothetical protein
MRATRRVMIALKYASLSKQEHAKFFSALNARNNGRMFQLQLQIISGWASTKTMYKTDHLSAYVLCFRKTQQMHYDLHN